jgi:hypothetical protein
MGVKGMNTNAVSTGAIVISCNFGKADGFLGSQQRFLQKM